MNRKQLGVTLILVVLMGVLLMGEKLFNNNIRRVTLTNNNIGELSSYSALEGAVNYSLPDTWDVEEKKYPGNYIVYDNNFVSREMGILGYVQVINTSNSIDIQIANDKGRLKASSIEGYETLKEKINGENIDVVIYKEKDSIGRVYINTIYYKKVDEDKMLKVLFSSNQDKYKESFKAIYEVILDSFEDNK